MAAGAALPLPVLAPLALLGVAAIALLLVFARPLTQTIVVGGADDRAATVGFFDRERNPAGIPYRWTTDRATLIFRGAALAFPANQPAALEARMVSGRPVGAAPIRVTFVSPIGLRVEHAVSGDTTVRVPLDTDASESVDTDASGPVDRRVTLEAETFTPARDKRELGVTVLGPVRLVQEQSAGIALPPWGAWWRWLATILAGYGAALGLLRRRTWRYPGALAAGGLLLAALTAAAVIDRPLLWQAIHLPLLAFAMALPVLWRCELAAGAARAVVGANRRGIGRPALVLAGLAALVPAQALLTANRLPLLALALYAAGIAVTLAALLVGRDALDDDAAALPAAKRTGLTRGELLALAGILILAAAARFYRLGDIPFSLWRDEARHGNEALRILADPTYRPVYVPEISLPGLYPLAIAGVLRLFGDSIVSLRGLTAAAGVAAVAALFVVARRLWGPRVALVAAFLAAVGSWRVSIDRLAFDTAPTTLCTLLALYAFLRGLDAARDGRRDRGLLAFAASGLAAGLAAYQYYPGRFAIVALAAGMALTLLIHGRAAAVRALPGLAVLVAVFAVTLIPLARYALAEPDQFFERSEQVFLLAPRYLQGLTELEAVERNAVRHLKMFNWQGEPNARHHAPKWPLLDPVTALCFAVGLALAVVGVVRGGPREQRFAAACTLSWLLVFLLPSIVSVDAPSAVRAQDAAPFAYLLAGVGLAALWRGVALTPAVYALTPQPPLPNLGEGTSRFSATGVRATPRQSAATTLTLTSLALAAALNLWLYFARLPGDPRVLEKFQYAGETRAGLLIAAAREREPALVVYLPRPYLDSEVLAFTTHGAPLKELPSRNNLPPGPALIVVPRGDDDEDYEAQLAAARRVAAAAGLREEPGGYPPGGATPTYIAFVR